MFLGGLKPPHEQDGREAAECAEGGADDEILKPRKDVWGRLEDQDVPQQQPGDGGGDDRGDHDGSERGRREIPRSTSRLKKTPPMGALKTAAIPPAAPHATKSRMRDAGTLRNCPTTDPIAAPIWAIGASRPTEPPEPIVTAAVKVRSPTVRGRRIPPCSAIASIALGTPSPLASLREPLEERTDQETPEEREEKHQVLVAAHRREDPAEKNPLEEPDEQDERHRAEAGQGSDERGQQEMERIVSDVEPLEGPIDETGASAAVPA